MSRLLEIIFCMNVFPLKIQRTLLRNIMLEYKIYNVL